MSNIYEKVQKIKSDLLKENLKKTGLNKFSNFSYFELADFLPQIIKLCNEKQVCTFVSFDNEMAKLTAVNSEKIDEKIEISSPMRELELKGCNLIQALGGVETYSRRYLYMSLFDITENDMFNSANGQKETETKKELPEKLVEEIALATDEKQLTKIFGSNKFNGDLNKQFLQLLGNKKKELKALKGGENANNK
jgi:hypothetical protein